MSNEAVNYIFIKFTKSGYSALRFYDNNEEKKLHNECILSIYWPKFRLGFLGVHFEAGVEGEGS